MKTFTDSLGEKHNMDFLYEHIKTQKDVTCLSFKGLESFFVLYDINLIIPRLTIIRMDDGEIGQHYLVLNRNQFKGVDSQAYAGPKGVYNVETCFQVVDRFSLEGIFIPKKYKIKNRNWDIFDENSRKYIEKNKTH
jgi:hypothetical protein